MSVKFKTYEVTCEIYWDASNLKSLIVRSKNEINAKKTVMEKMKKTYNTDMVMVVHVREITNPDELNTHLHTHLHTH